MIEFNVSDRLKIIAGLIKRNNTVADIGTDHGYLPIYLTKEGKAGKVIACDLRKKPLERAINNARDMGVEEKIDFRLSDGLEAISSGEADTIIICGMGGFAIRKILTKALNEGKVPVGTECILSPHTDRESLSGYLFENGFKIEDEILLHEKAAYYILWRCVYDAKPREAPEEVHAYGALLLNEKSQELKSFILREEELLLRVKNKLETLPPEKSEERMNQIKERLDLNRSVRWF